MTDQAVLPVEPPSGGIQISYSQISMWEGCGEKVKLAYVDKRPPIPQGAFIAGIAGHETLHQAELEGWWREPMPKPKDPALAEHPLVAHFRAGLVEAVQERGGQQEIRWAGKKSKEFPDGENAVWWFERMIPHTMRRYHYLRNMHDFTGTRYFRGTQGVEMEVVMPLPSGNWVKARVDVFITVDPDGARQIFDYKFGQPSGGDPFQLALYAKAVEHVHGIRVESGQFGYLRSAKDETLLQTVDLRPLLPLVDRKIEDYERARELGFFPLKNSSYCPGCAWRVWCPYGKTLGTDDLPESWRDMA